MNKQNTFSNPLTTEDMIYIMKNQLINDLDKEQREQVFEFAFGRQFMKSKSKGKLVKYTSEDSELLNLMSATFNYKLDFESWSHKKFVKFTRDFIDGKTEYLMDDMFITNDLQRVKQLLEEVTNE